MGSADGIVFREVQVKEVLSRLEKGQWCTVIAPRFSGKTVLAHQLREAIREANPKWRGAYVSLRGCSTLDTAWQKVVTEIAPSARLSSTGPDSRFVRDQVTDILRSSDQGVYCLLLDDLDDLPDEVLRLMADDFRGLRNDSGALDLRRRLHCIFFGAMKLHYLDLGESSPFHGVVERIELPDLNMEDAIRSLLRRVGPTADSPEVRDELSRQTAGHPYLVDMIAKGLHAEEATADSIRVVANNWSEHCGENDECFGDIIRYLQQHARAFDVVRRMVENLGGGVSSLGNTDLALMSGAVAEREGRFVFRGLMIEQALRSYFDSLRKADYSCLHGDWVQAQVYYSGIDPALIRSRRPRREEQAKTGIMDLMLGLSSTVLRLRYLGDAETQVALIGCYFFGADETTLWRMKPGDGKPLAAVVGRSPHEGLQELASAAMRNGTAPTLLDNRGVIQSIVGAPDGTRWALQLNFKGGIPGDWVKTGLHYLEPSLYMLLSQAERREADARAQREQRNLIHEIALKVQTATRAREVFEEILAGVTNRLGYECAQVSLLFPEGRIRAVAGNGAFMVIKSQTDRDLEGQDVLALVMRERRSRVIKDCHTADSHCDPVAIAEAGLESQVIVPMFVGNEAIGTLQVGNTESQGAFNESDADLLQLFADAAAISIQMAQEWESLDLALHAVGDSMVVVDTDGRVISCNQAYAQMFQVKKGDAAPLTRVEQDPSSPTLIRIAFGRKQPVVQTLRKIGTQRFIVTAASRRDNFERFAGGVEVIGTKNPLSGLTEALTRMLASTSEAELGQTVVDSLRELLGYSRVRFYLATPDGRQLDSAWSSGMSASVAEAFGSRKYSIRSSPDGAACDGFDCFRLDAPVVIVRQRHAEAGLPIGQVVRDSQHRNVLVEPEDVLTFVEEFGKQDVWEWLDVPLGPGSDPVGKLTVEQKDGETPFGLEDLELLDLYRRWTSSLMLRVRETERTRKAAQLAAQDVRHLGERGGMHAVAWHFLLHITMHGGPGANRAAIFLRQPRSEDVAGFLCHGAASSVEFRNAVKQLGNQISDGRDKLIESISQQKVLGEIPDSERERIKAFQQLLIRPDESGSPFAEALKSRQTISVREPQHALRKFYELLAWEPSQDAIILPLLFEGECEGLLYADKAFVPTGICNSGDDKILQAPCTHLAAAARSARLAEQLRHQVLGLSHSTLAPMTAIDGLARVMLPGVTTARQRQFLDLIVAEAARGIDQLRRMLDVTRLSSGELRAECTLTEIHGLIRERIRPYQLLLREEGVGVIDHVPADPLYISVDPGLFGAAIAKLAANALSAIRSSGVSGGKRYLLVQCEQEVTGTSTMITFENSSRRVPTSVRDRMFDLFVSGSGSTGVGLSFVRDAIRLHGGSVEYQPVGDTASRFVVRTPNGKEVGN